MFQFNGSCQKANKKNYTHGNANTNVTLKLSREKKLVENLEEEKKYFDEGNKQKT